MPERKTVGQLMEEMRLKAGAQNYHGHEYMDLERFADDTRHMIMVHVQELPQRNMNLPESILIKRWGMLALLAVLIRILVVSVG